MNLETDHSNPKPAPAAATPRSTAPMEKNSVPSRNQFKGLILFTAVLAVVFGRSLFNLATFSFHSEFYSYILLIPAVSIYLVWIKRGELKPELRSNLSIALLLFATGAAALVGYWLALRHGWAQERPDRLAVTTLSFLLFLLGGGFLFLGSKYLRALTFPVAFLFFCIPFPMVVRSGIETFLQHGSAEIAYLMLTATGMPVFRTGTYFQLPSMQLEVAPECSGIHSTMVLVITSLLAAYLFLKTPSTRWILMLVVIPLALLRNGFRIFVIAQLCVRIGPQMIDSAIHRRGGPVFFVLSLVPLFLLLLYLSKRESRKTQAMAARPKE
jgi:exosortase C (VPDSG-CTERM-specific)